MDARYQSSDALGRLLGFGLAFLFVAAALALSFVVTPADIESGRVVLSPTCTFKSITGHECLTCGMTRAFAALSHGDLGRAVEYNRGSPVLYVAFWVIAAATLVACVRAGRDFRRARSAAPHGAQVPAVETTHARGVGSPNRELADHP